MTAVFAMIFGDMTPKAKINQGDYSKQKLLYCEGNGHKNMATC